MNVDVNPGDTTLTVEEASRILAGDIIYIINGAQWEQLTVQSVNRAVNPNTITTTAGTCNAYPWGTQVGWPRLVTYGWYDNPDLDGVAPPAACVALNPNTIYRDEGEGGGLQPVADVQNSQQGATLFLNQLQYFDAADNPTAIPANIRRMTITLAVQSPPGWWKPQAFAMTSDIRPRNL